MRQPAIDRSRLDVVRDVAQREKAALDAATSAFNGDLEAAARLRQRILDLGRQVEARPRGPAKAELAAAQNERTDLDARIASGAQTIEIQRERHRAAVKLRTRCVDRVQEIVD